MKFLSLCIALLSGLTLQAAVPSVMATYWDAPSLARLTALMPLILPTAKQNIQVLVYGGTDAPESYRIRVDYIAKDGTRQSQESIAITQGGSAMVSFWNVDDVTFISTTVTPYSKSGDPLVVPH